MGPTLRSVIGAVVLLVAAACQSTTQNAVPSNKVREYATVAGLPVILTRVNGAERDVEIYLSLSCPICMNLYNDLMQGGLLTSNALDNSNVSFFFIPRFDSDHILIKNLFCVSHKDLLATVSGYYQSAARRFTLERLPSLSAATARRFGVSDDELADCRASRASDLAIVAVWERAWRQNPTGEWPLVLIDGRSTRIESSAELLDALEEEDE